MKFLLSFILVFYFIKDNKIKTLIPRKLHFRYTLDQPPHTTNCIEISSFVSFVVSELIGACAGGGGGGRRQAPGRGAYRQSDTDIKSLITLIVVNLGANKVKNLTGID